jgi:hypothetical protein
MIENRQATYDEHLQGSSSPLQECQRLRLISTPRASLKLPRYLFTIEKTKRDLIPRFQATPTASLSRF